MSEDKERDRLRVFVATGHLRPGLSRHVVEAAVGNRDLETISLAELRRLVQELRRLAIERTKRRAEVLQYLSQTDEPAERQLIRLALKVNEL